MRIGRKELGHRITITVVSVDFVLMYNTGILIETLALKKCSSRRKSLAELWSFSQLSFVQNNNYSKRVCCQCTSKIMHQSIETPTPPTNVKSYQMPHPLGPNFLSKWIKMRQPPPPPGSGNSDKKKWKIARILSKQIPISKQALLALFILAWFLQIKWKETHFYNMYVIQKIHSFSKQRANIQRDIKRSKFFMV